MVLVELLAGLRGLVKVKHDADIHSAIFKLHFRLTATMLFCFCLLVTANSLVGDPINCVHDDNPKLKDKVVNTYCWIHTTFTLPKHIDKGYGRGTGVAYPGVGPLYPTDTKTYHAYYQWVPFVLFLQGLMFYAPHWLWKTWEGGKLESIVMGLSIPVMNKEERHEKIHLLADYLHASLHHHNFYAIKFFLCELLNLANCLFNMWFMNEFLGGMFFTYGIDVLAFTETNQEERTDPMIVVFPRVTKCSFNMYGPSGTIETHDLMCVLALNIINEKIYVFMWFWFVILAIISTMALIYRLLVFCVPAIRSGLLQKRARLRYKNSIDTVSRRLQVGDFFLLYLLSKNVELLSFSSLMEELSLRLSNRRVHPDLDVSPAPVPPERFHLINENA
ncbi:innexin inx2-like [Penaeus chinensis]|uniref:innexin inx2-like n=1 Tax=Penaeus chinensis TaxID=139456 RepID=UPI001FB85E88|nr:innexin inx2-like [Penaeus chinensis]XP_047502132.1 innexin inx2-like [Penaeus chinensis]XP_047502140.1 innexin inx2-like [Penaeus chinensis]XP_047502150.1 innexin inx2-like [Penaeus chinensis]XP_047502159.1 innexin inx2-like [Penaeus chinensis]XP_047502166.1 innexin inx2-like [Penaeus chinensis]XP_047502174.1 innexin inx2-like [Penaeus chinensis]XP_047502181.1 innexin inx2-like [Penaeus chinensis]XP_047502189.1 innexin inx2-like [Penaeus chinensis]